MKNFDIDKIIGLLKKDKTPRSDFVLLMEKFNDPFLVLISCILSLRTNDKITYPATLRMLELAKTSKEFCEKNQKNSNFLNELEQAIYPVGFYKNKAKQIIEIAEIIEKKYNGKTPNTIEELLKFKGVGRKTANLVLAKGHNIPAICVDVHVHRICNRWGYVNTKEPDATELELRKILPQKYWLDFNTLLVTHGQNICKPIKPFCEKCSLKNFCKNYKN